MVRLEGTGGEIAGRVILFSTENLSVKFKQKIYEHFLWQFNNKTLILKSLLAYFVASSFESMYYFHFWVFYIDTLEMIRRSSF